MRAASSTARMKPVRSQIIYHPSCFGARCGPNFRCYIVCIIAFIATWIHAGPSLGPSKSIPRGLEDAVEAESSARGWCRCRNLLSCRLLGRPLQLEALSHSESPRVLLFTVHSGAVYVLCVFIMNAPSCVNSQLECVNPHGASRAVRTCTCTRTCYSRIRTYLS